MPEYVVDLHNHTPFVPADYDMGRAATPRQMVARALDAGIDVFGVTDHSTVAFAREFISAAEELAEETGRRLLVIPGAELRLTWQRDEVHVVVLFAPGTELERFAALVGALWAGEMPSVQQLPWFRIEYDPLEVCELARRLGAICHIGHIDRPIAGRMLLESPLAARLLADERVCAFETVSEFPPVRLDGAPIIQSSDSHSYDDIGRRTFRLELPELSFEGLRAALCRRRQVSFSRS